MKSVDFDCTIWANVSMLSAVMLFWHSAAALTIMVCDVDVVVVVCFFFSVLLFYIITVLFEKAICPYYILLRLSSDWSEQKISSRLCIRTYVLQVRSFVFLALASFDRHTQHDICYRLKGILMFS
uniref:Uncharacterized protein n=1 Tax=Glossina pallidipes TaxID=7398 RepID=A0A1A9ZPF1_GLOPL